MSVFTASYDTMARIITAFTLVVLAVVPASAVASGEDVTQIAVCMPALVFVLVLIYGLGFRPLRFEITPSEVIIHRWFRNVTIPVRSIQRVEVLDRAPAKGTLRTLGSGGFFGYLGTFYTLGYGFMNWHLTHRKRPVLIVADRGKYLLSPDDSDAFAADLEHMIGSKV